MRRRSVRAACSRACCAEWSSRCCCRPGSSCCPPALGAALGLHYDLLRGLRRWARWLTHPLDLWFALSVLAANLWFARASAAGSSASSPSWEARWAQRAILPGQAACFCPFLEASGNFLRPRTAPCPRKQKIFRKNGNFSKTSFHREKIGYNKKQTPPHAAARYQQRGRRAGAACRKHHS